MDVEHRGPEPKPLVKGNKWLIAVAAIGVVYVISLLVGGEKGQFSGRAVSYSPESSAYLRVNLEIENTGDSSGSPSCTVGAYIGETRVGFDILDGEELSPGETQRGNMVLTIENESAAAVDDVRVTDC